jgi:predicted O-methyltransferase YrrM
VAYENVRGAKRVLMIGMALDDRSLSPASMLAPDGMLIVMEADPVRAEQARQLFSRSGLADKATVIGGDPRRMMYKLAGPFDAIFCDVAYLSARETLEKLLAPDGVLVANDGESR